MTSVLQSDQSSPNPTIASRNNCPINPIYMPDHGKCSDLRRGKEGESPRKGFEVRRQMKWLLLPESAKLCKFGMIFA